MKTFILNALILFSIIGYSQEKSNYSQAVSNAISSYQIKDYNRMGLYLETALQYIEGEDSLVQKAQVYNNFGVLKWKLGDFKNSVRYYQMSIDIYTKNMKDSLKAEAEYNFGLVLKDMEIYDLAISNYSSALLFFERNKNNNKIFKIYTALGNLYREKGQFKKAETYQLMALDVLNSLKNENKKAMVFHNLGMLYNKNGEFEKAKYYLFEARLIKVRAGKKTASTLAQIGQYYLNVNKLDSAECYFKSSLQELKLGSNQSKLVTANLHMGSLYLQKKDYESATLYLNFAFEIADSMKLTGSLSKILELQIVLGKALGKTDELLMKYELLILNNKETWGINEQKAAAEQSGKYNDFKQKQEIKLKDNQLIVEKLENERLNYRNWLLVSGIGSAILIIIGFAWNRIKLKKSKQSIEIKNSELSEKNEMVDTLHRELSHRTKNYYQMFAGMLRYDQKYLNYPEVQKVLNRYVSRVKAMSEIHRYLHSEKTISGTVKLNLYLSNLLAIINQALNSNQPKIDIQENFIEIDFDYDKALRLGLVMNEIVSNAFEHGFSNHKSPSILLELSIKNDFLTLTIKDNGSGFKPDISSLKNATKGVGIIKNILNSINGRFEYQTSSTGTFVVIYISNKKG